MATERTTYENKVSEDVTVSAGIGYGRWVEMKVSVGSLTVSLSIDPSDAREIGLALMDAANSADHAKPNAA